MAGGHHYVPGEVTRALSAMLSTDAINEFEASMTGNPDGLRHDFSSLPAVGDRKRKLPHSQYNQEVLAAVQKRIEQYRKAGKLVGGKLTGAQAKAIVDGIKSNGLGRPFIVDFNRAVLKSLRLIALGGIVAKSLAEVGKAQELANREKFKQHYKKALEALRQGDWHKADNEIRGGHLSDDNLIWELQRAGYVREAGILADRWMKRVEEFRKIENGQHVPGVPDDF